MEDYTIGATNGIALWHGHQTGQSSHTICTDNHQAADKICGTLATQDQAALLSQIGIAEGHCAVVEVGQVFSAGGAQTQAIGDCVNPMLQGEEFGLFGSQLLSKSEGGGSGQSNNIFLGSQGQASGNPIGAMSESSSTGAFQNSMLAGGPGATGLLVNSMSVDKTQVQAID